MTSKELSTITYNTPDFLKSVLDHWVEEHRIQNYAFIKHIGECGDKDHIHLYIMPNKVLDPMDLTEELKEYEKGSDKPLKPVGWRRSDVYPWLLYVLHDEEYMILKNKSTTKTDPDGKIPYKLVDVVAHENFQTEHIFLRAKRELVEGSSSSLLKRLESGISAKTLIAEGNDVYKVKALLQTLQITQFETLARDYQDLYHEHEQILKQLAEHKIFIYKDEKDKIVVDTENMTPFQEED